MGKKSNNSKSGRNKGGGRGKSSGGSNNNNDNTKSQPMWRRWDVLGFALIALVVGIFMQYYQKTTNSNDETMTSNKEDELLLDAKDNPLLSKDDDEDISMLSSNERWVQVGPTIIGPHEKSLFGDSLLWLEEEREGGGAMTLAVGAPFTFEMSGMVQLFSLQQEEVEQNKNWKNHVNFTLDLVDDDDAVAEANQFGKSLAASRMGDVVSLWIGAHDFKETTGIVQRYTKQITNEDSSFSPWRTSTDNWIGDEFVHGHGFCIATSSDHDDVIIAVASPGYTKGRGKVQTRRLQAGSNHQQKLATLEGAIRSENYGSTISLNHDGTILAIGSPMYNIYNDTDMVEQSGMTRIYKRQNDETSWTLLTEITGITTKEWSGQSVSLNHDGTRIAIGVPGHGDAKSTPMVGLVRVYEQQQEGDESSWIQVGPDIEGQSSSQFGYKVVLSKDGNLVVVSAIYKSFGEERKRAGSVQLYRYLPGDAGRGGASWEKVGQELKGKAYGDWFGSAIALLELEEEAEAGGKDRLLQLAVGANGRNNGGHGYVKVFELDSQ